MADRTCSPARNFLAIILVSALLAGAIALPLGLMAQGITARTFYLSPAGSDQGAGTREDPWADPFLASQQLQPGDTLILLPGVYRLTEKAPISPAVSGTTDAWITIQGEEGSRPLLQGSGGMPVAIDLRGRSRIRLAHLEISSALDDPYTGGLLVGIEAGTTETAGEAVSQLELEDLAIHHVEAVGIHLQGNAQDLTLRDITVSYTGAAGILAFDGADGVGGERATLERVTCSNIGAFAQGQEQRSGWEEPDCLAIGRSIGPMTILRSTFELSYGDGIDSQANQTLIEGCTVANNAGDGIKLGGTGSRVVNSLVFGIGYLTPWEETTSSLLVIESEEEGGTFQVTNCTFFDDVQRAGWPNAWRMQQQNSGVRLQVGLRNTIVAGLIRGSCDESVELAVDHCLFWNRLDEEGVQVEFVEANGSPSRAVTADELSGWGSENLYGDPLFFLPSWGPDGDFHLQPGSPALSAGTPEGAPPVDLKNHARANPPDIGAYQQSEGAPLPRESPSTISPSLPFPDLAGHWAEVAVRGMVAAGLMNGYPDDTFRPDRPITRGEFCKAFAKTFSIPPSSAASPFPDIETHWARGEILALVGLQALRGYPDGAFQPDQPISRAEIASILQRSFGLLPLEQLESPEAPSFSDLSPDFWAHAAVQAVVAGGLMRGYPDGAFRPLEQTTRAEAVTVLARSQTLPLPSPAPQATASPTAPSPSPTPPGALVAPPNQPVRLVFIHHSTGENWLADDNGGLGAALRDSNYFASDTNYGWGPEGIGDRTDFGNWWEWFR
ncbi:MAG: S-layer homology domain-containing protein, partial [bacterium]